MDRKSRKVQSVDGFVPSKLNSPLSNPFDKINKAKLGGRPGIIPHRKATSFGNFNEGFISSQPKASLGSIPVNPALGSAAMVSVAPDIAEEEVPVKKITRRERKQNQQLERFKK